MTVLWRLLNLAVIQTKFKITHKPFTIWSTRLFLWSWYRTLVKKMCCNAFRCHPVNRLCEFPQHKEIVASIHSVFSQLHLYGVMDCFDYRFPVSANDVKGNNKARKSVCIFQLLNLRVRIVCNLQQCLRNLSCNILISLANIANIIKLF